MNLQDLTLTLVESFNALADEVQNLNDRQTILEHKLRFAHEQFQYLADKHAPAAPEISETLVKLQIPPELHNQSLANTNFVPLPKRNNNNNNAASNSNSNSKHEIALIIREGRRVASSLTAATEFSKSAGSQSQSQSSREDNDNDVNNYHYYNSNNNNTNNNNSSSRPPTTMTSLSTILEQDFTVEGNRRGNLECPFSVSQPKLEDPRTMVANGHDQGEEGEGGGHDNHNDHNTAAAAAAHHDASDPICATMLYDDHDLDHEAGGSQPTTSGAVKCPIRFMDHHSPEEIAHYLETHKHELPRSHEVCVRRYQKSEEQVKKLDAKYGNMANMVEGLGRIHQPMLPEQDTRPQSDVEIEKVSNERVENWAQTVSATVTDDPDHHHDAALLLEHERGSSEGGGRHGEGASGDRDGDGDDDGQGDERQGRFDRPLKEVRVGESPSRPWGISVPIYDYDTPSGRRGELGERPESPPPAPVPMPPSALPLPLPLSSSSNDHSHSHPATPPTTKGMMEGRKCPFDHAKMRQMMGGGGVSHHTTPIKREDEDEESSSVRLEDIPPLPPSPTIHHERDHEPFTKRPLPAGTGGNRHASGGSDRRSPQQPAFLNAPDVTRPKFGGGGGGGIGGGSGSGRSGTPQMLFTGPVFIGYPVEQAIQIIQAFQGQQQ